MVCRLAEIGLTFFFLIWAKSDNGSDFHPGFKNTIQEWAELIFAWKRCQIVPCRSITIGLTFYKSQAKNASAISEVMLSWYLQTISPEVTDIWSYIVGADQFQSVLNSENLKLFKVWSRSLKIDVLRHGLPIGQDRSYFFSNLNFKWQWIRFPSML